MRFVNIPQNEVSFMTILCDYQIAGYCQGDKPLVSPFDENLLNGVSLDIRVGYSALIEDLPRSDFEAVIDPSSPLSRYKPNFAEVDLSPFTVEEPYLVEPNEFLLVASLEVFNMPNNIAGEFRLRSTFARFGFDQSLAVWLEPEWTDSVLTLELKNNCRYHRLPLFPEMRLGQVIFHEVKPPLKKKYSTLGHYNGDRKVQAAKV